MKIKNWHKFQHFKDRRPPWIKLYRDLLDDPDWFELDDRSRSVLVMLWLIASETDGYLPDIKRMTFRLRMPETELNHVLSTLKHWIEPGDISEMPERHQDDAPETETETEEESEKETKTERRATKVAYGFQGKIIKLTTSDHDRWRKTFSYLDLDAELEARELWLADQPVSEQKKWMVSTATLLRNRNAAAMNAPKETRVNGYHAPRGALPGGRLEFRGSAAKPDPKPMTEEERKKADEVWRLAKQSIKTVSVQ